MKTIITLFLALLCHLSADADHQSLDDLSRSLFSEARHYAQVEHPIAYDALRNAYHRWSGINFLFVALPSS